MPDTVDMAALGQRWKTELLLGKNADKDWVTRSKRIVKRYKDERSGAARSSKKYNILWSNVQTILPAVYSKTPKAEAERRNKDSDPVGRCASEILERSLQYELDNRDDYDEAIKSAILDRLLGGRGTAWVRFETEEVAHAEGTEDLAEEANETPQQEAAEHSMLESSPVDYVYWEDFRCSPARVWGEVTWVARRVYMSRKEGVKRFGDDFKQVNLTHVPIGLDQLKEQGATQGETEAMKKAEVWEIWDRTSKQVIWIAEGFDHALDVRADPYGLDDFWPMPKPLFSTQTTDTLVPIPDYSQYQDQAEELDMLTQRISMLVEAVKVAGVYDASQSSIQRLLSEGTNNTLIPVDTWAAFAEKGGIKGVIDWLPLDQVVKALDQCYAAREQAKQVIYEITGLSDIIRGATNAQETATAQQIKSNFGSLRLKRMQRDIAMFASQILRIKAQMMSDLYSPQSLMQMSGILSTDDGKDQQLVMSALQLLRTEPMRSFRVNVAADSLVDLDEQQEKADRVEFLKAAGGFLQEAIPAATQFPALGNLMGEMLMFGVRAFKAGRPIEAAFDQAVQQLSQPQPPKPNPEVMKIQADQQASQAKMQADQQAAVARMQADAQIAQTKAQADIQIAQAKAQATAQIEQAKAQMQTQVDINRQQAEADQQRMKMENEARLAQLKAQYDEAANLRDMEFQRWKAELDAATKIQVANIMSQAKVDNAATETSTNEIAADVTQ
jgi:hypothetical protein